jgi:hypothetical protein
MDTASTGIFAQIVIAIVVTAAIFFIFMIIEILYRANLTYSQNRIPIYPYTGSGAKTKIIRQDPTNPNSITIPLSDNQLTGIEFSYSTFLYISDDTDDGSEGWKSVFYKGYESGPFPLMGPGVFVSSSNSESSAPVLRVVMNTYDSWFNVIDVKQVPFNKWVHLVIALRKNTMEVYINGNLANKKSFNGTLPYQNYQPIILFPSIRYTNVSEWKNPSTEQSTKRGIPPGENFLINGKFTGYISNMYYFPYAMTYSEIQAMMDMGPSSEFDQDNMDRPPYLIDSWWTQRKGM